MTSTTPVKTRFSNGLTILYLQTPGDPISSGHLFLPVGSVDDPPRREGLTSLLWSLFAKGTEKKSARQFAEAMEAAGASIHATGGQDYSLVSFQSLTESFLDTYDLAVEALFHPVFPEGEVRKEKSALLAAIEARKEQIFTVTAEKTNKALFGDHPYAIPSLGKPESVSKLYSDDLFRWHSKTLLPNQAVLVLSDARPFDAMLSRIENHFSADAWPWGKFNWKKRLQTPLFPSDRKKISANSHFEQAFLMMAKPAPSISNQDYPAMMLLNNLFGGGMSSRLFQSVREERALCYDVGSYFPTRRTEGGFYVYLGLDGAKMDEAVAVVMKEWDRLQEELIPENELREAKDFLKGSYLLDHQTNSQRAYYLGWWRQFGLSSDFDSIYLEEVENLTSERLRTVARHYFSKPAVVVQIFPSKKRGGD